MSVIFVLITCDSGFEKAVIAELKTLNFIKYVLGVMGSYDIIVKLESENKDKLQKLITLIIRKTSHVKTTLTLLVES